MGGRADSFEKLSDAELLNPFSASNERKKPEKYPRKVESLCGHQMTFCGGYDGHNQRRWSWKEISHLNDYHEQKHFLIGNNRALFNDTYALKAIESLRNLVF